MNLFADDSQTFPTQRSGAGLWQRWSAHFSQNTAEDALPWQAPPCLPDQKRRALVTSLAVFQLGESGDGTALRRFARRLRDDPRFRGYESTLGQFIGEENRHSRVLARLVSRLGGELIETQWTNFVFRKARRLINLEFELQIMMTAELIAEAYYGLLREHVEDPCVQGACERILRDEVQHLCFHIDFFTLRQATWWPWLVALWRTQFRSVFWLTSQVVWRDHRACFQSLGIDYQIYSMRCQRAVNAYLNRLNRQVTRERAAHATAMGPCSSAVTSLEESIEGLQK